MTKTNDQAALAYRNVSFAYPGQEATDAVLDQVSFSVPRGSFALLVGETGSGKSTLLSLAKPQIAPAGALHGSIEVFGTPVESLSTEQSARTVGYVFQNPNNQIVCETVWHEMAFGLENLGAPQDEMRRLVAETSYFFGIDDWMRRPTDELSGGRKQVLALASTLVMQPRLLLLDEPTSQLDPIAEKNFLHALFRANRELGCTVVVATHSPQAMIDYATCAFELTGGGVASVENLGALARRPRLLGSPGTRPGSAPVERELGEGERAAREPDAAGPQAADSRAPKPDTAGPHAAQPETAEPDAADSHAPTPAALGPDAPEPHAAKPAVSCSGVWFRYTRDANWVARNLDVRVSAGRIHALVGGNGCGKSTLLSLIAGIEKPVRGRVRVQPGGLALLPQDPRALFAAETVHDELMEWGPRAGYDERAVERMIAAMGLTARSELHPYDLSGGQQQLLALGKLLLLKPQTLLLDEPTKGLDATARALVARALTRLRADGVTIVMATHDLDFVLQVADCVSMMFDGEIACTQPADEFFRGNVYYRP